MTHTVEKVAEAREKLVAMLDEATASYNDHAADLRSKIGKLDDWLWKNEEKSADSVTEEYIALRDERSALKSDYDRVDDRLKEQMDKREAWLLEQLNMLDAESLRTNHGTAFVQTKVRASGADWPLVWQFVKDNDRFDLLEKRIAQGVIKKMMDDGEELPPGISTFTERVVTIRRKS